MAPRTARRRKSKPVRRRPTQPPASPNRAPTASTSSTAISQPNGPIITRTRHATTGSAWGQNSSSSSSSTTSQHTASECFFFERLPPGVFDMILQRLSVQDMSVFSMVSKHTNGFVMEHISSAAWRRRAIVQSFHSGPPYDHRAATTQHYRDLGLLFKRCTLLLPTKDRLKFTFSKFSQVSCFVMEPCAAVAAPGCYGLSCYGAFLKTLIAGWDKMEYPRLFSFLCDVTGLLRKIQAAVAGRPGGDRSAELRVRRFCRHVLLDPWWHEDDRADFLYWLAHILKPLPMVSQARLLFLLYGPLGPDGSVRWRSMLDAGVHRTALLDLSKVVFLLHGDAALRDWSTDTMLAILEELTVLPEAWHVENVGCLLLQCGSSLSYSVLTSKALNGRLFEVSRLIIYIVMVCERDGYCMSWPVKLVHNLCQVFTTSEARRAFVECLENTFTELTMEMYELIMADNHFEEMETVCRLLHSSANFHSTILQMFLK